MGIRTPPPGWNPSENEANKEKLGAQRERVRQVPVTPLEHWIQSILSEDVLPDPPLNFSGG